MISTEFKQNVASGDLDTVRSALIDSLIIDRTFKSFDEALAYAQNTLDIIEPFNSEPPFSEKPWDSNYLNRQKVALMMNFSNERINHIKQVISDVMPANEVEKQPVTHKADSSTPSAKKSATKTGRTVISERPIQNRNATQSPANKPYRKVQEKPVSAPRNTKVQEKPVSAPHNTNRSTDGSAKTGTRVIRETVSPSKKTESKENSDTGFLSTALIVGGAAVAVVGVATVEPIVIGAGVVVAGTGVGLKVKNGR